MDKQREIEFGTTLITDGFEEERQREEIHLANVTEEMVKRHSRKTGEPRWLADKRSRLFRLYREKGLPGQWEEEWQGTNLRGMGILSLPVSFSKALENIPSQAKPKGDPKHGSNGKSPHIFTDLFEIVQQAPDLLKSYLFSTYDLDHHPSLAALNGALMRDGALLHIPEGYKDEEVRKIVFHPPPLERTVFPHNLIVLKKGSRAAFVEEYLSPEDSGPIFSNSVTEVIVEQNARVDLLTLLRWDSTTVCCHRAVARVAEGGSLRWYIGTLGGGQVRIDAEVALEGPGAESYIAGIGIGERERHLDHRTVQRHVSGDTKSRIHFGTLLWGKSTSIYRGMIQMDTEAIRSDAYQKNDNLILEAGPRAKTIPKLEILTDEVKCSHGSTVGRIREEDLFYMTSRGIPNNRAKALIAEGFIRRILSCAGDDSRLAGELQNALVTRTQELENPG